MKNLNVLFIRAVFFILPGVVQADLNIFEGGASGEYYAPERVLEGFFIEVVQQDSGRAIVVTWYTYDLGRQMWLAGNAPLTDGAESVEVPMEVFGGTDFGAAFVGAVLARHMIDFVYAILGMGTLFGDVTRVSVDSTKGTVVFVLLLSFFLILRRKRCLGPAIVVTFKNGISVSFIDAPVWSKRVERGVSGRSGERLRSTQRRG